MWGAKVRLISTHNGADNLFNELILDSRADRKRYSVHTITLDDACAEGLYQRICQVSKQEWTAEKEAEWKENLLNDTATKEDAEEEYYCVPKYQEMQDWCETTLQPISQTLDETQLHFLGEDFARSGDMTSFVVLAQQQNLTKSVRLIVELGNMPYKQQEQIVLFIFKHLPRFAGAAFDARGNGGYLAEAARDAFGSLVDCVQLSEKWYREHTAPFKAALEDGELDSIPKDADILADLRSFQVVKGVPRIPDKRTKSADGKNKRHGDTAISLLLAHYASRQLVQLPVKAHSRKPRASRKLTQGY